MPLVGVVMGSASDEPVVQETVTTLEQMQIDYEVRVLSAHRTRSGFGSTPSKPGREASRS